MCALEPVGLKDEVLQQAVPMRGRMIHGLDGGLAFQSYGVSDAQAIHSVSRGGLNAILLSAAEKYPNVRLFFDHKCTDVDIDGRKAEFVDATTGQHKTVSADVIVSADGAFSAVRKAMQRGDRFDYRQDYLEHGYKELTIPPGPGGEFLLEKNALHIWPRRSFMMIALGNADASFTATLFWPFEGKNSFMAIRDRGDLERFFRAQFPDAAPLMPHFVEDYFGNPTGSLVTVRCFPWHVEDRVVLLGDAAHAVVPFYGQGMNAAFEDVLVLNQCMERCKPDWRLAFGEYERLRKPNADALADLAIGNFVEMRDKTGSKVFLMKKKGEKLLAKLLPGIYVPLYTMVSFTRTPYAEAVKRAKQQIRWLVAASTVGLLLVLILGFLSAR